MWTSWSVGVLCGCSNHCARPVLRGCKITNSFLEKEEWFAIRVARLQLGVVPLSFFDVTFQPRLLLHEFIMMSSRLDDRTVGDAQAGFRKLAGMPCGRPHTARTRSCRFILSQGFPRGAQQELTESARAVIRAVWPWSRVWGTKRTVLTSRPLR